MADYDHLDLPDNPTTDGLRMLIGDDALEQLSVDFGGAAISIPLRATESGPIAYCIGLEAAKRLSDIWGGMVMTVPVRPSRNARILRMYNDGVPINRIARIIGTDRSVVYRVIKASAAKDQYDLF